MVATADTPSSGPAPGPLWDGHFTPTERAWIRRAAFLRAHAHDWNAIAEQLQVSQDVLLERIEMYQLFFRKEVWFYERENMRHACREACMILRSLLRSSKSSDRTKAADLLVRLEMNRYRYRPRPCRCSSCRRTATTVTPPPKPHRPPFVPTDKPKTPKKPPPDPILQCFPDTAKGRLARDIYRQAEVMTHEQMAAKWEDMFRRECFKRRIPIPGVEFEEYWLKEGYDGEDAVGWDKNDPIFQVYLQLRRQGVVDYHTIRHKIAELCGADAANVYEMREKCRMLLHTNWGRGVGKGPRPPKGSADENGTSPSNLTNDISSPETAPATSVSSAHAVSPDGHLDQKNSFSVGNSVSSTPVSGTQDATVRSASEVQSTPSEKQDHKGESNVTTDIDADLTMAEPVATGIDKPVPSASGVSPQAAPGGANPSTEAVELREVKHREVPEQGRREEAKPTADCGNGGQIPSHSGSGSATSGHSPAEVGTNGGSWEYHDHEISEDAKDYLDWDEIDEAIFDNDPDEDTWDEPDDDPKDRGPSGGFGGGPRGRGPSGGGRGGPGASGGRGGASGSDTGKSQRGGRRGRGGRSSPKFDPSQLFRFGIIDIGPRNQEHAGRGFGSWGRSPCDEWTTGTSEEPARSNGGVLQRFPATSQRWSLKMADHSAPLCADSPDRRYPTGEPCARLYHIRWGLDRVRTPPYHNSLRWGSQIPLHTLVLFPYYSRTIDPMAALGQRTGQRDLPTRKVGGCCVGSAWSKGLWIVAGLLLWGWGTASPVRAGCGDHLPVQWSVFGPSLSLSVGGEGQQPDGSPQRVPCMGLGCSPAPDVPPLSIQPPQVVERDQPTWAVNVVTSPVCSPHCREYTDFPFGQALPEGALADIFHPPRPQP
jgi:hypothetical protein